MTLIKNPNSPNKPLNNPLAFTIKADGLLRALVTEVFISEAHDPKIQAPPTLKKFLGIWDTGATHTMITKNVVSECNLAPTGRVMVQTAGGSQQVLTYFVNIGLPNMVQIPQIRVSEGILDGDADVLIGMDIISHGDFAITNKNGETTFSFRIPSITEIDFVRDSALNQPVVRPSRKIGRNEPCPCGSGKKYKKCCGANV